LEVNNKLIFRFATKEDCELVFSWINDPLVRQNSYNSDTIPFETHKNWFLGKIENPDSFYLIFYFNNIPAGQVRLIIYRQDKLELIKILKILLVY